MLCGVEVVCESLQYFLRSVGRVWCVDDTSQNWTRREVLATVGAVGVGGLSGCGSSTSSPSTPESTTTPTPEPPSVGEIEEWLVDRGVVVLSIEEDDGKLQVVTELGYSKEDDRNSIGRVAKTYARAVENGYRKTVDGALMPVDASSQVRYRIRVHEARKYNRDEYTFREYVDDIMASYCCR